MVSKIHNTGLKVSKGLMTVLILLFLCVNVSALTNTFVLDKCSTSYNATNSKDYVDFYPSLCAVSLPYTNESCVAGESGYLGESGDSMAFWFRVDTLTPTYTCQLKVTEYSTQGVTGIESVSFTNSENDQTIARFKESSSSKATCNKIETYYNFDELLKTGLINETSLHGDNKITLDFNSKTSVQRVEVSCFEDISLSITDNLVFDENAYSAGQDVTLEMEIVNQTSQGVVDIYKNVSYVMLFQNARTEITFKELSSCREIESGNDILISCPLDVMPNKFLIKFSPLVARSYLYQRILYYINYETGTSSSNIIGTSSLIASAAPEGVLESYDSVWFKPVDGSRKFPGDLEFGEVYSTAQASCADSNTNNIELVITNENSGQACRYYSNLKSDFGIFTVDLLRNFSTKNVGCVAPFEFKKSGLYTFKVNCDAGRCSGNCYFPAPTTMPNTYAGWEEYLGRGGIFSSYYADELVSDCVCNSDGVYTKISTATGNSIRFNNPDSGNVAEIFCSSVADGFCPEDYEDESGVSVSCAAQQDPDCGFTGVTNLDSFLLSVGFIQETNLIDTENSNGARIDVTEDTSDIEYHNFSFAIISDVDTPKSFSEFKFSYARDEPTVYFDGALVGVCNVNRDPVCYLWDDTNYVLSLFHPLSDHELTVSFEYARFPIFTVVVVVLAILLPVLLLRRRKSSMVLANFLQMLKKLEGGPGNTTKNLPADIKAIALYAEQMQKNGSSVEKIKKSLHDAGWATHLIELVVIGLHEDNANDEKIRSYMAFCLRQGVTKSKIYGIMMSVGVNRKIIDEAYKNV